MEKTIEVYGKEIKSEDGKKKFISTSLKVGKDKNGKNEYVNVRFTQDANVKLVKGYNKVKFDTADSNVKTNHREDGTSYRVLYIKKAEIVPYTDEEKEKMSQRQEQAVLNLFD